MESRISKGNIVWVYCFGSLIQPSGFRKRMTHLQHKVNFNIEKVLKLASDNLPNTTSVTKGGKTGNLFAQSVLRTDDQEDKKR